MGFNINKLIGKRVSVQGKKKEVLLPVEKLNVKEDIQEIVVPVYDLSEPILPEVIKRKKVKNEDLHRKVPLNPLSDE